MNCMKCGTVLPDGTKFCNHCGTPTSQEQNNQPRFIQPEHTNTQNQSINVGPVPINNQINVESAPTSTPNQQAPVNPIHQEFGGVNVNNQVNYPQQQTNNVPNQYSSNNASQYPTSNTQSSYNNSNMYGVSDDELLQEFIGKNYDKVVKTNKNGQLTNNTASWLGFFFGPIWFFYRKMYLFGFLIMVAIYIINQILSLFNWELGSVFVAIIYYFVATQIYLFHAKKKIDKVKSTHPSADGETLKQLVRKKGGTSIISAIIYLIVWIGLVVLMFWALIFSSNFTFEDTSGSYRMTGTIPSEWQYSSDQTNLTNGMCTFTVLFGNPVYGAEAIINQTYSYPTLTQPEIVTIKGNQWTKQEFETYSTKVRIVYIETDNAFYIGQFTANTSEQFSSCENDFNTIEKSLKYK